MYHYNDDLNTVLLEKVDQFCYIADMSDQMEDNIQQWRQGLGVQCAWVWQNETTAVSLRTATQYPSRSVPFTLISTLKKCCVSTWSKWHTTSAQMLLPVYLESMRFCYRIVLDETCSMEWRVILILALNEPIHFSQICAIDDSWLDHRSDLDIRPQTCSASYSCYG